MEPLLSTPPRPRLRLVVAVVWASACGQNDANESYIGGRVEDSNEAPIADVLVSAYGITALTNAKGDFQLSGVDLKGIDRVVVNFQRDGYFDKTSGTRTTGGSPYVRTAMLAREELGTVDAADGGTLTADGLSIEVPPGAFVNADGSAISGKVSVFGAVVSPDDDNFARTMPGGDFTASDDAGDDGVLTSFGALVVEAETEEGDEAELALRLATCMAIPSSMMDVAPDTLPLWELDPAGTWQESGVAERDGDRYCFYLDRMGQINCDLFSRTALVTGRVCAGGTPVPEAPIELHQYETATDDAGVYGALVPANTSFSLRSEHGSAEVDGIPGGETLEIDLGDCGDTFGSSQGYFRVVEHGYSNCYLHFEVAGSRVSDNCPECEWSFDWAYDVRFNWSEAMTDLSGCDTNDGAIDVEYAASYWEEYADYMFDIWAFAPSSPYGAVMTFLYQYDDNNSELYPSYYFPAVESGTLVTFSYYYFEGGFDPASGQGADAAPGNPTSLPSSGVGR